VLITLIAGLTGAVAFGTVSSTFLRKRDLA